MFGDKYFGVIRLAYKLTHGVSSRVSRVESRSHSHKTASLLMYGGGMRALTVFGGLAMHSQSGSILDKNQEVLLGGQSPKIPTCSSRVSFRRLFAANH